MMGILLHLMRALRTNKSSKIRKNAALILGKLGDKKAVDVLIKALNDGVISVRSNAAIALGMIGDKRAVKPLLCRLHSPAWQERLNAAVSLGWIADQQAINPLLSLLYDQHGYVRRGAAFALGQIADPEIKGKLFKLLAGENPAYEAALVLAYMGDLTGFFYLAQLPRYHFSEGTGKRKKKNAAVEELKLGNLFYHSQLYQEAVAEYRRALRFGEKNGLEKQSGLSRNLCCRILNNLGNALHAYGFAEEAIVSYLLAFRSDRREKAVLDNLDKSEILLDIQEYVLDQLKNWMEHKEAAALEPPPQLFSFFQSTFKEREFFQHFVMGWKSFYAFQAYEGKELFSHSNGVPAEFLGKQVPVCRSILFSDPTYLKVQQILVKLSDIFIPELEKKKLEEIVFFHKIFIHGYLAGLLQKIWHLSHLAFSDN